MITIVASQIRLAPITITMHTVANSATAKVTEPLAEEAGLALSDLLTESKGTIHIGPPPPNRA